MKRTFLSFVGGVALCFSMLFSSCGNGDNALEEIINGSGNGEVAKYAQLADALQDGAEIEVAYTVYGSETEYKVKIVKQGDTFVPQGDAGLPTGLDYTLSGSMAYANNKLTFTLKATPTEEWIEAHPILMDVRAGTRAVASPPEYNGENVMVVTFDTQTIKYDVVSAPGFSFKVLNVKGLPVQIENACSKTAEIDFNLYINEDVIPVKYAINHNGETWESFADRYDLLDDEDGDKIIYKGGENILFSLEDYSFVYGNYLDGRILDWSSPVTSEANVEDGKTYLLQPANNI